MQQNHDFEQAYAELSTAVYRYARYKLSSKEAAEDVTAETFVRLLENPKSQEANNLKAWTLAIARNIILNTYKQQKVLPLTTKGEETSLIEGPEQGQLTAELLRTLQDELQSLESETREIIILKTWEELKFDEIAEVMNLNVNNVKAKYYRGIEDLKMKLNTEDKDKKARSVALPVILLGIAGLAKANVLAPSPEFLGKLWEKIGAEFSNLNINCQEMSKNSIKQLLTRKLFIAAAIMTVVLVAGIAGVTLLVVNNNSSSVVEPEAQQSSDELPTEPVLVPEEPTDEESGWVAKQFSWYDRQVQIMVPADTTVGENIGYGGGSARSVQNSEFKMNFNSPNEYAPSHVNNYKSIGAGNAWRELFYVEYPEIGSGIKFGYTNRISNDTAYCNQSGGLYPEVAVPCAYLITITCDPVSGDEVSVAARGICDKVIKSLQVVSGEKLGGDIVLIGIPAQSVDMKVIVFPSSSAVISPYGQVVEYATLADTGLVMGFSYPRDAAPMQFGEQVDIAGSTIPGLKRVKVIGDDQSTWWYTTSAETALIVTTDGMMQVTCKADSASALAECDELARTMYTAPL